jgi:flagellar biosynthetic protein FliO
MFALAQAVTDPALPTGVDLTRGLFAVVVVFGLLALFAYLAKKGLLGGLTRQGRGPVKVETSVPLGERRSLVIVTVEGRRLLLGLTPVQVSLVTELGTAPATFEDTLTRTVASTPASSS